MSDRTSDKVLRVPDGINPNVLSCEYAVRGLLYKKAMERQAAGKEVIFTNVGNPHALGQQPLTFPRQVLALVSLPALMDNHETARTFPPDAIARARQLLDFFPGGTGAYQDSRGNINVRREVARFLEERDGFPADAERIFLHNGASPAIQLVLRMIIRGRTDGILLPIPQYPLYSASVELFNGTNVGYPLDEANGWSLDIAAARRSVQEARRRGITLRAMVVINPGNPTGQLLSLDNMREIVEFCHEEHLVLLADEVYQTNIYGDRAWHSFRKVVLSHPVAHGIELFSFHTVSKGAFGECGRRGGYFDMLNISADIVDQAYKLMSINLSTNVDGQVYVSLMVNPPRQGDPSFERYDQECREAIASLRRRAIIVSDGLDAIPGVSCNFVEGAMYAFPQIKLPQGAITAAKKEGLAPDVFYCLQLLEETGICTVPGSGFGQAEGTLHFRTTILPPEHEMKRFVHLFSEFHTNFVRRYGAHSKL